MDKPNFVKQIEIVLASHGENLLWADGLQKVITEYSTQGQSTSVSEKHKNRTLTNIHHFANARHSDTLGIHAFTESLRNMVSTARQLSIDINEILSDQAQEKGGESSVLLRGHKVIQIDNNPNLNEANHFLAHIIQRYDTLAETTVFMQAYPLDHIKKPMAEILSSLGQDFCTLPNSQKKKLGTEGHDLLARELGEIILKKATPQQGIEINSSSWSAGGCFMASKRAILRNSLSWYELVLKSAKEFNGAKWALERLWAVVISPNEDWS